MNLRPLLSKLPMLILGVLIGAAVTLLASHGGWTGLWVALLTLAWLVSKPRTYQRSSRRKATR